jgi:cysteine desulfuration protein SufE
MNNHPNITEISNQLVEDFSLFDNWEDKYEYLIDLGKKLSPMAAEFKTEDRKIKGCQSTVWLYSEHKDGRIYYQADSEAIIVKGLVSMLVKVLSGQKPEDIVSTTLDFIEKIGLQSHLAQTRANGLNAMIRQMKLDAAIMGN